MSDTTHRNAEPFLDQPQDQPGTRHQTSSEKHFRVYERSWRQRFRRDIRILIYLSKLYYRWLVVGGRIRKAWRNADKSGQPFILEKVLGMEK